MKNSKDNNNAMNNNNMDNKEREERECREAAIEERRQATLQHREDCQRRARESSGTEKGQIDATKPESQYKGDKNH